ncbi:helix-turn-helix domain-containing protein [Nocardia sp. NPDC058705]|uniref:helix-turn-helix domain-containing protein n=1 Tax=Nocardia sp. NPDC058705 TaxID=3346609 RepID=UPI00367A0A02
MAIETYEFSSPTPRSAARDEWEALMSQTYVPLAVDTHPEAPFYGRVTTGSLTGPDDFSLTALAGSNQAFRRSKGHVARSSDGYLLASIHTKGGACLHQHGRSAPVSGGDMVFYDTTVPYHWTNGSGDWSDSRDFEQVVVQVPISLLRDQPGLEQLELPTAVTVPADSAAGVVAGFFRKLARFQHEAPAEAEVLAGSALGLIGSAVLLAAGERPTDSPAEALSREHVMVYLRKRFIDPELSVDEVAAACHISRRTLFRIFDGGESFNASLRKLRVRHAQSLLISSNSHPSGAIAFGSGFASERHFYRAFHRETGMTPGEYRQSRRSGIC